MAYTASFIVKTVMGNERVHQIRVTADAASGTVDTGMGDIHLVQWSPRSCTTTGFRVRDNATAADVASQGTVGVSGAASGDVFYLTVYGR